MHAAASELRRQWNVHRSGGGNDGGINSRCDGSFNTFPTLRSRVLLRHGVCQGVVGFDKRDVGAIGLEKASQVPFADRPGADDEHPVLPPTHAVSWPPPARIARDRSDTDSRPLDIRMIGIQSRVIDDQDIAIRQQRGIR